MNPNYESEQNVLISRVDELRSIMNAEKESTLDLEYFLALVRKYIDIKELTAEIIREFIEKIFIHKAEHIDGRRVQRIKIVFNCIGEVDPLVPVPITEKEKSA
ncbi:hypothetical protein SDC9_209028 [bioreactor metagenome]|uniref:DUF4368 domain-containing protein n=1 Tax=bioreactor metagenome TaxID=1076179 RepID=A0A645JNY1_9ZZZZ